VILVRNPDPKRRSTAADRYYAEKLSAERLRRCYEIAPARVKRYLAAEAEYVASLVEPGASVLELGCGYGRLLRLLDRRPRALVGIDTSIASLRMARRDADLAGTTQLLAMDAVKLGFRGCCFDLVVCIQNGISAFHVDQRLLIEEAIRVTCAGGRVVFSSYTDAFWDERLEWFRMQAQEGLLGEIDEEATRDGVIVCKDGFRATTVGVERFRSLTAGLAESVEIFEVDGSSLICEITVDRSPTA
jgi:2-polyprenyl-6-hydroxyphenyl methylase/3-demethylubiquinone-9 3-methyltransferase